MNQSLQGATFHVEHIIPASRGGPSIPDNLAWCCPSCNLHKSDRTTFADPDSGQPAPLFHPRINVWHEHFAWLDDHLVGLTPAARATIAALQSNADRRLRIREAEERFGLFPPA